MKRRWYNIFKKDNRSFILAMDHAIVMDVCDNLKNPGVIIEKAVAGGVDSILTSYGVAQHFQREIGNAGLILRVDGGTTKMHPDGFVFDRATNTFTVEDAVRVGADGVLCMGFTGLDDEDNMVRTLARFAGDCSKYGLVYGIELVPGGFKDPQKNTLENVAFSCRLGAEYGADFIKSTYVGEPLQYREHVVEHCYKPIVILGGGAGKTIHDLLSMVKEGIDAGCCGVAIGRNIWTHPRVEQLCAAISGIIHEDMTVEAAEKILA